MIITYFYVCKTQMIQFITSNPTLIRIFSKYIFVGVLNTAVTGLVIFALMSFDINVYISNALGYISGVALSFILNSLLTFSTKLTFSKLIKFLVGCFICYLVNLIVINVFLVFFSEYKYIAQLFGMGIYTVCGFFINKVWVMR